MNKVILIFVIILNFSCASRKVTKADSSVESRVEQVIIDTTKQKTTSTTKISDTTSVSEITLEPIDPTKEIIVDGKKYKNVRFKTLKSKKGVTILKENNSSLNQGKTINNKIEETIDTSTKNTETSSSSWLWIVVIVTGGLVIYFDSKRHN